MKYLIKSNARNTIVSGIAFCFIYIQLLNKFVVDGVEGFDIVIL